MGRAILVSLLLAASLASGFILMRWIEHWRPARRLQATSQPTLVASSRSVEEGLRSYLGLLKQHYPHFPATQPLPYHIDFRYAGHFIIPEPVYLDRSTIYRSNLWITHSDAPDTAELLDQERFDQVIVTRLRPVFVHWRLAPNRVLQLYIICGIENGDGFEIISARGRHPIGRKGVTYDWPRATSLNDRFVVPTTHGVSVFLIEPAIRELVSPPLADPTVPHARVEYQFEGDGLIAWIPPAGDHLGSAGVARFAGGTWTRLSSGDWPVRILHLIPFLDGSILQLIAQDDGSVRLNIVQPQAQRVDPRRVAELVGELADADPKIRDKAFKELSQFGPGAHPFIEKMVDGEPPETQSRLRDLLRSRVTPLLGHMRLLPGKLRLLSRHPDGGALFFAENGVSIPRGDEPAQIVRPAWLSIRPGRSVSLLDAAMVRDLDPDKVTIIPYFNEWIVIDDVHGPRRYFGNALVPLLREGERRYTDFVGIDAEGRFLFRQPAQSSAPAAGGTLVIDPNFPDPTPRLPGWEISDADAIAGWDSNHYPALSKGASAAALRESDWRFLDLAKERFFSRASDVPRFQPHTRPADPTLLPSDPLLIDRHGTTYFDGRTALVMVRRDGSQLSWRLPDSAAGEGPVFLIEARDGTLFLFNQPGRLLRIRPPEKPTETFTLEATFTRRIPNTSDISRLWLDPLNRIAIAHSNNRLTLLFPEGYIPPSTASLMPPDDGGGE